MHFYYLFHYFKFMNTPLPVKQIIYYTPVCMVNCPQGYHNEQMEKLVLKYLFTSPLHFNPTIQSMATSFDKDLCIVCVPSVLFLSWFSWLKSLLCQKGEEVQT